MTEATTTGYHDRVIAGPILVNGAINLDLIYRLPWREAERFLGDLLPRGGEAVLVGPAQEIITWIGSRGTLLGNHPGGSAANTAVALARLGVPVAFLGRLGDDPEGSFLLRELADVDRSLVQRGGVSGRCIILVDDDGERSILKLPGANDLWEPPSGNRCGTGVTWSHVHLTSLSAEDGPQRQAGLLSAAGDVPSISLDPGGLYASRGRGALDCLLSRATHLFLNRRERDLLFGDPPDRAALLAPPRRVVMTKLGSDGLLLEEVGGESVAVPPEPIIAVDTTGAGDAAAAGYLAAERRGLPFRVRGRVAALCGALAATRPGREGYAGASVLRECSGPGEAG